MLARYQLFVDDSGTREYDDGRDYVRSGKTLYFVYGAILIKQDDAASLLIPSLLDLKRITFGQTYVEIKSNWLRMPQERRTRYLDRFNLTEDQISKFTDDYYRLVNQAPLSLLACVVNKLHMQEKYKQRAWYPPTAAYEFLLQRAVQAIPEGSTLSVTIDDISGKTPKSNDYKQLVAHHHERLRKFGSPLQRHISFACLDAPVRFVLSQDSEPIQATDLISYNVHRQFVNHGEDWEKAPTEAALLPTYPYFNRIAKKFRQDENGRIQGFGIVKCPVLNKLPWKIDKKEE